MSEKQQLRTWLADHKISEVEAIIPDQAGIARGKVMPAKTFGAQGGMRLPESVFIQTVTGEHPEETVFSPTDRDMIAEPDLSTIRVVPWANEPTAVVIHDCFLMDGTPVDIAPRQVLRRILDLYAERGLRPVVAPEIEFYLVKRNTDPDYPLTPPTGRSGRAETVRQPYSLDAIDEFEPLIEDIYDYCEAMEMQVDNLVHEEGTAQLEVNFLHGCAMALSDQMFLFKRIVRETAMRHEVYATFMAKPMQNEPGSSMHWHLSLVSAAEGHNVFSRPDGSESETFRHFIGGLHTYLPNEVLAQHPRLTASRLYAMVRSRGYTGGPDHFRHQLAHYRPPPTPEAYLRLRTLPGEQAQVDWGHFGTLTVGRAVHALMAFVMVLSWCRQILLRFYLDARMANFLRGHEAAFAAWGGLARVLLYDNLKSAVLERQGQAIRFHPTLLEFAAHYRFEPRPVALARGNEKGRVERAVRYVRDAFFAARTFTDLDDLTTRTGKSSARSPG